MNAALLLIPGLVALAVAAATGRGRLPIQPRPTLSVLTAIAAASAAVSLLVTTAVATAFVLGPTNQAALVRWCRLVPVHHRVDPALGFMSLAVLAVMVSRIIGVIRRELRVLAHVPDERISVVDAAEPWAYAVPRGDGCIVVSTGMLAALEPRERQVVFAHERAHLRQHHHRYLLLATLSQAVLPPLSGLVSQLRMATERCADEEAVVAMSGDRAIVAKAIARAALERSAHHAMAPAFGGGSVTGRVEALVGEPAAQVGLAGAKVYGLGAAFVLAGLVQLHHLYRLLDHICVG